MTHLLCGRGMLAQLHFELELIGSKRPAIMHMARDRRKALRAARLLSRVDGRSIPVCRQDVPADSDFLILAGGRTLADMTAHDPRRRALVPLGDSDLDGLDEPLVDFLVLDASFISAGSHLDDFFDSFCRFLAPETGEGGFRHFVSGLAGRRLPTFRFSTKTKVRAGDSALNQLPRLLDEKRICRPLLMTDTGIVNAGILETVRSCMGDRDVEVFDGIPQDSSLAMVNDISRIYNDTDRDGLIALGGGSVLDTGKGVYLNVSTGSDDLSNWAGSDIIPELKVPFIAIPTTSGTGSEATKNAVL
ncbi:MAG: iron-containing alcohol dehydrogenase, partial [Spirochaetaceae bacterium]|nr:iron-containing alcohol dehydrogenase [Spirochaetaceae bacterium]